MGTTMVMVTAMVTKKKISSAMDEQKKVAKNSIEYVQETDCFIFGINARNQCAKQSALCGSVALYG